jgi:hypothetical protein
MSSVTSPLGYSRRLYVRPFRNERQESWFAGVEGAFRHFGGVTEEVLLDNDRGLVAHHDRATREVDFNARLHAFAKHWGFRPRACAPYRARTKGKDERGVGYVKNNAIAGRHFESWPALEAHLDGWVRDIADQRVHGTTGEVPIERFQRAEAVALRSVAGIPPFGLERKLAQGDKALVANKGFRRFLKTPEGDGFVIDRAKIEADARFDGLFVLRTTTKITALQVVLRYRHLLAVEDAFKTAKALLATRPIFHKTDAGIRGHVFCTFLALVLRKELFDRFAARRCRLEWQRIVDDLDDLSEIDVEQDSRRARLRTAPGPTIDPICRAIGITLPPIFQEMPPAP